MSRLRHKGSRHRMKGGACAPERRRGGHVKHERPESQHGEGEHPKQRGDRRKRGGGLGSGTSKFRVPSGGVSSQGRREAEKHHETMAGGRFPIRNRQDLMNAKHSIGRAKGDKSAVRAWINKRARELDAPPLGVTKHHKD